MAKDLVGSILLSEAPIIDGVNGHELKDLRRSPKAELSHGER